MDNILRKTRDYFYRSPFLTTIVLSLLGSFLCSLILNVIYIFQEYSNPFLYDLFLGMLLLFPLLLSIVLTIENILLMFTKRKGNWVLTSIKRWEVVSIIVGAIFSLILIPFSNITFNDWEVQLINNEMHTPISTNAFLTIVIIAVIAIIGYIVLSFFPLEKLPPLFAVLCISAIYLGIVECLLWCVQIFSPLYSTTILLCLFPFNCILIAIRTIKNVVHQQISRKENVSSKFWRITKLLNNIDNWPWIAFILAMPLLGIIVSILLLFGQEPDSIIKAWTETSDWNLSQKQAPQNIYKDEHYLCTVAAGGHKNIVKPLHIGKRHGHRVIVNRQLCIANAFEQLLEERLPKLHHFVRTLYDKLGYPIAKHIRSAYAADIIYFLMKPLEWIFLIILYLFDAKPENRIATQYPHSNLLAFIEQNNHD